jgi:hypothetical protein
MRRQEMLPEVIQAIRRLPFGIPSHPWNERDQSEPLIERVDTTSFGALQEEAMQYLERVSIFAKLVGKRSAASHLARCSLYLPAPFVECFETADIPTGSLYSLQTELSARNWGTAAHEAVACMRRVVEHAVRVRLPLIVDA